MKDLSAKVSRRTRNASRNWTAIWVIWVNIMTCTYSISFPFPLLPPSLQKKDFTLGGGWWVVDGGWWLVGGFYRGGWIEHIFILIPFTIGRELDLDKEEKRGTAVPLPPPSFRPPSPPFFFLLFSPLTSSPPRGRHWGGGGGGGKYLGIFTFPCENFLNMGRGFNFLLNFFLSNSNEEKF